MSEVATETLLRVRNLTVRFPMPRPRLVGPRPWLTAVDAVDLEIDAGRALGLVGESGCGKSTLGARHPRAGRRRRRARSSGAGSRCGATTRRACAACVASCRSCSRIPSAASIRA